MKTILTTLALALSLPAFAVYAPDWERPVQEAQMDVVQADGYFTGAQNVTLTMNRRDGKKAMATSFNLEVSLPQRESAHPVEYLIPVSEISASDKGNMIIKGQLKLYDEDAATGYFPNVEIELVRPYDMTGKQPTDDQWIATVRFLERGSVNSTSSLKLSGTPESVATIQKLTR
ncbi:MAG: hypothetical protein ABIR96_03595 [Bdellovibrionota bacterium]